jgi:hypothetical protein
LQHLKINGKGLQLPTLGALAVVACPDRFVIEVVDSLLILAIRIFIICGWFVGGSERLAGKIGASKKETLESPFSIALRIYVRFGARCFRARWWR